MDQNPQKLQKWQTGIHSKGYIIDSYSPYSSNNDNVKFKFNLNERQWCIREVDVYDNLPLIDLSIEDTSKPEDFYVYSSFAEAYYFMKELKRINKL